MPRVKIDYIASFSSEDPDNPASNLLSWEISKKKWLCKKGEASCSVVLQLARAVQISTVDIGVHNAAIVEVLVGRSENPSDQFEVLVPSCVLLSPSESRASSDAGAGASRVRSFPATALTAAASRVWDRLRVVCSQPYNRHIQYGLSFVHVFSSETDASAASAPLREAATQPGAAQTGRGARVSLAAEGSSSDEEFRPGELFAQRHRADTHNTTTEAQIRQVTSQALKNIDSSSTRLVKTPINKQHNKRDCNNSELTADRKRDALLYNKEDADSHKKIDRVVQQHNQQKHKDEAGTSKVLDKQKVSSPAVDGNKRKRPADDDRASKRERKSNVECEKKNNKNVESDKRISDKNEVPKERHSGLSSAATAVADNPDKNADVRGSRPLEGCGVCLSGFAGAARAELRALAAALGARYHPDLATTTTHLVCAFPNTPKLKAMRGVSPRCVAVTEEWLRRCEREHARVPWQRYAVDPALRSAAPPLDPPAATRRTPDKSDHDEDTECDTDDDIKRVMRDQKRSSESDGSDAPSETTVVGASARGAAERVDIEPGAALPRSYDGHTFRVGADVARAGYDPGLLARYIRAFGGVLVEDEDSAAEFVVSTAEGGAPRTLPPALVWEARLPAPRTGHTRTIK